MVQFWVDLDHEFSEAASEEHEGFFILVRIEECTRDVNCGNVASLVGIDGSSDHNAVSGNYGGGTVFLLLLLAVVGTGTCLHSSIAFFGNIHEGCKGLPAFVRG